MVSLNGEAKLARRKFGGAQVAFALWAIEELSEPGTVQKICPRLFSMLLLDHLAHTSIALQRVVPYYGSRALSSGKRRHPEDRNGVLANLLKRKLAAVG
jgi:hypothetical protein